MRRAILATLLTLLPVVVAAQEPIASALTPLKPADRTRISNIATSREKALTAAETTGKPDDLRAAKDLLALPSQPLEPATLTGKWRCRSIHLGGMSPLTVNPFFECRIVRERGALYLEKITGGTRRKARLSPLDERRLLFYGAYRAAGDKPQPYGADDYRDEAGILERVGRDRLRVELPEPRAYNTARHEVFELVRGR